MSNSIPSYDSLDIPIRLSFPVISINTFELSRAESAVRDSAKRLKKGFKLMEFKALPSPNFFTELAGKASGDDLNGVVVLDRFFFDRAKVNPEAIPALKASIEELERHGINYIIAGRDYVNEEFVYHLDLPPMEQEEITSLLKECEANIPSSVELFHATERVVIANHARGLSYTQMKNVFNYIAYLKYKKQDYLGEIRREKNHILRDVGLDILESVPIGSVGGLENLKEFLDIRKAGWDRDLPVKGLLLVGVPGGGKSLAAKAAADVFGTALVSLDMSRFYSKFLGETEAKFARALHTIEQISPVVVLIDEMEKAFGTGEGEHEVSKRLLGKFLSWLQERKKKIFIVGTANRVSALPPELMRAGRWDRSFFIDLPSQAERSAIFGIHLRKNQAAVDEFDVPMLVRMSEGYTGAEIEQAVIDALYLANAKDQQINQKILVEALQQITPTSETRKEDINRIRALRNDGFYPANRYEEETPQAGRRISV
ncbi:AAA family ATPase [Pseudomonas aeruginosa]|nr:AAA family ATPase [Pseudomonas aeruginosa]MBW6123082.1 AAA family ATPase [Pseudomonas aeruginosa]